MENENRINFRIESVNVEAANKEMAHSLRIRTLKATNNQINNNQNIFWENGSPNFQRFSNKNQDLMDFNKAEKKDYQNIRQRHSDLITKGNKGLENSKKKYLKKDKSSLAMGVFTFPKLIDDLLNESKSKEDEIFQVGIKCLKEFSKTFNCNIRYLTLHRDEKGNSHFQWMVEDFDKDTGNTLNIMTNKQNGELVQDILIKHFKPYGFARGLSKDLTKRHHLTTEEFKKMKDKEKMFDELENQNVELQIKLIDVEKELKEKEKQAIKYENYFNECENYTEDVQIKMGQILIEISEANIIYKQKDMIGFMKIVDRIMARGNYDELDKLMAKVQKLIDKAPPKRKNTIQL